MVGMPMGIEHATPTHGGSRPVGIGQQGRQYERACIRQGAHGM